MIEPITNHTRTSVSTATVRQVECKHFPDGNQLFITYYDGEKCLGKFHIGEDHKLTNLKESSKEIKVEAVDEYGNIAEGNFNVSQDIPMISYEYMSRTPTSVVVRGIQLANFPSEDGVLITYSCDGHDRVSYNWKKEHSAEVDHELPGYHTFCNEGHILVTATNVGTEYKAECQIVINGPGKKKSTILVNANNHLYSIQLEQQFKIFENEQ